MADSNKMKWYVLRAISGKEMKVKEYIDNALVTSSLFQEYVSQVLIPQEKSFTLRNGKRVTKLRNKLPGYVLVECNMDDDTCFPLLRNIPNVLGFLMDKRGSSKPAPVSQAEVDALIGNIEDIDEESVEEIFLEGEKVKVTDGPFNGFVGVVSEVMADKHKLRVVVTIFERETPLELSFNQVCKE